MITDEQRIEFLERQFKLMATDVHNRVCFRESCYGRGARLHHTKAINWQPNFDTVRDALDAAISAHDGQGS